MHAIYTDNKTLYLDLTEQVQHFYLHQVLACCFPSVLSTHGRTHIIYEMQIAV